MNRLDPEVLAYLAIIGIDLILIGALITPGQVGLNERSALLAGIVASLFLVAYRWHRRNSRGGDEP